MKMKMELTQRLLLLQELLLLALACGALAGDAHVGGLRRRHRPA